MRYLLVTSVVYICNVSSLESVFNHERFLAEEQKNSAIDIVVNPNNINLVPLFDSGYSLPKSNNMLYSNGITAVMEANQKRVIYTIQDDDSLMVKSDKVSKNPDKYLNESGKVIDRKFKSFNVAHCERCARDYYLVVGRKEKKRYVYLKEAPYITASKNCSSINSSGERSPISGVQRATFSDISRKIPNCVKNAADAAVCSPIPARTIMQMKNRCYLSCIKPWRFPA